MKRLSFVKTAIMIALASLGLSSCNLTSSYSVASPTLKTNQSIKKQAQEMLDKGFGIEIGSFVMDIPNNKGGQATISASSGSLYLGLDGLSIHKLKLDLDAPLSYNGVTKVIQANVPGDEKLYVSLTDPSALTPSRPGVLLKASIAPMDSTEELNSSESGVDSSTRGVYYYEYGQLDYFIASVLESFGVEPFKLFNQEGGFAVDSQAIINAFDEIEEIRTDYYRYKPLGQGNSLSLGLESENGVISKIEFPCQEDSGSHDQYELENGLKVYFGGLVKAATDHDYEPPFADSAYMQIEDSLALVTELGNYVSAKQYGFVGSFSLVHNEAAVAGSSTTFARPAVEESATLEISGNADLTEEGDNIGVSLALRQGSNLESIALNLARKDQGKNRKAYLEVNHSSNPSNAIKFKTDTKTVSSLFADLKLALSNKDIENETITSLISGLLASGKQINAAIDAIKGSALFASIEKNEYQSILDTIVSYSYGPELMTLKVDLSKISMVGQATVTLSKNGSSLISVSLDNVGIKTDDPENPFEFTIDGSLNVTNYAEKQINEAEYDELDGLPGWQDWIEQIAGAVDEEGNYISNPTHQLTANLSGYLIKTNKNDPSVDVSSDISVPITTFDGVHTTTKSQGFTFSGEMGFDLAKKIGTGHAVITDHKKKFLNDHNLKVDVTGPESELDVDSKKNNDFSGNDAPNGGYMLFQYDSKNSTATKNISGSKTTDPEQSPLKGRLSISSLDDILGIVTSILQSDEPRFTRLTNSFNDFSTKTTIGAIMNGKYLSALSAGFLDSVDIGTDSDLFRFKPGLLSEDGVLRMRLNYASSNGKKGAPTGLEIEIDGSSIVYARIDFVTTSWKDNPPTFNWYQEGKDSSYYAGLGLASYSSLSTLLEYVQDTITVGGTKANGGTTTYKISGEIDITLLGTYSFQLDLSLIMAGTSLKLFGAVKTPYFLGLLTEAGVNFYYETDGNSTTETNYIYFSRIIRNRVLGIASSTSQDTAKVSTQNFKDYILDWLLGYVLNMSNLITDNIDSSASSNKALHGEDIIKSITTSGSRNNATWDIVVMMRGLTHVNIFKDLTLEIEGGLVNDGNGGKKVLKSLWGETQIGVDLGSLKLNVVKMYLGSENKSKKVTIENVSSGTYKEAWNSSSYTCPVFSRNGRNIASTSYSGATASTKISKNVTEYVKPGTKA